MFSSRKQGTKHAQNSLLAPWYVQRFIHLVNFHVGKNYKLQTPTHSKTNSHNVTSLYKMYCEHLKILHIQCHPQIQHPIPLSNLYICQIYGFQATNTRISWPIFVHKKKIVQVFNLKPTFPKCCDNSRNIIYSFYFDMVG